METVHIFDAYFRSVRSLLVINYSGMQSRPFTRILSVDKSRKGDTRANNYGHHLLKAMSSQDQDSSSNSILVSFGVGFKGTVGNCPDHPENFLLPSEGSKVSYQAAVPEKEACYLLLWSTEVSNTPKTTKDKSVKCEILNESEELSFPDNAITGTEQT